MSGHQYIEKTTRNDANAATNSTVDTAFQNFRILDNTYLQFQVILSHVSACEHVTIVFELQENGGELRSLGRPRAAIPTFASLNKNHTSVS